MPLKKKEKESLKHNLKSLGAVLHLSDTGLRVFKIRALQLILDQLSLLSRHLYSHIQ